MKKETAKERKLREELENKVRWERKYLVEDVKNYWRDVEAAERYLKTSGKYLDDEEKTRLIERYDRLKEFNTIGSNNRDDHRWSVIRYIVEQVDSFKHTYSDRRVDKNLTTKLAEDDLLIHDTTWGIDHVRDILDLALRFGYKRVVLTDHGSSMSDNIALFIEMGAVVEGTTYNTSNGHFGLILNITNSKVDRSLIDDEDVKEDIKNKLRALGTSVNYNFSREEVEHEVITKYSPIYGVVKTVETYSSLVDIVKGEVNDTKNNN